MAAAPEAASATDFSRGSSWPATARNAPRPQECGADSGHPVSRSAQASVCPRSNLVAVPAPPRRQNHGPTERHSGRSPWRLWRSRAVDEGEQACITMDSIAVARLQNFAYYFITQKIGGLIDLSTAAAPILDFLLLSFDRFGLAPPRGCPWRLGALAVRFRKKCSRLVASRLRKVQSLQTDT